MLRYQFGGCSPIVCAFALIAAAAAQTPTETVIFNFKRFPQGANPYGALVRAENGALYGTTFAGGAANLGVVFEYAGSSYKALYSFQGGTDGANPFAGVVQDTAGNLYGTTYSGGKSNAGVVYRLTPAGQESVLYAFTGGSDGGNPYASVILDSAGNVYGTALYGGLSNCTGGCGVVYKVTPTGQETVLHSFTGGADGATPYGNLISDPDGNMYGTTEAGGTGSGGVVFELSASGQWSVLHTFGPGVSYPGGSPKTGLVRDGAGNLYGTASDGIFELEATGKYKALSIFHCTNIGFEYPWSSLAIDSAGNLYGTTTQISSVNCGPPLGAVYKLEPSGTLKTVYQFPRASAPDAGEPPLVVANPGVVVDPQGSIFGATPFGGTSGMIYKIDSSGETTLYTFPGAATGTFPQPFILDGKQGSFYGSTYYGGAANVGMVYRLDQDGTEKVLHTFTGGADGRNADDQVARDSQGNVYGTTGYGGTENEGVVFKVSESGQFGVLHSFTGGADGGIPQGGLIVDPEGNVYGTTAQGGGGSQTGAQEGVVFMLDPAGNETVLYSFMGLADGGVPKAGVTRDSAGNLYGTASEGGDGFGTVFEISAAGEYSVLHSFTGPGTGGGDPNAGVILDESGNLYGTAGAFGVTADGNPGDGLIYKISRTGVFTVLYTFTGGADGGEPLAPVVRDTSGNLYGSTIGGGDSGCPGGCGVIYEISPSGQESVLHTFTNGTDGVGGGTLILTPAGVLYGFSGASGGAPGGEIYSISPVATTAAAVR